MPQLHSDDAEASFYASIREMQSLSRLPLPLFRTPPWQRIRELLPMERQLLEQPVQVLVVLDLDASGVVVAAEVGEVPEALNTARAVAICVGIDGRAVVSAELDGAPEDVALAVTRAFIGERFSPAERDGVPVAFKQFRMSIGIRPEDLR
jgi:hypothetical protein